MVQTAQRTAKQEVELTVNYQVGESCQPVQGQEHPVSLAMNYTGQAGLPLWSRPGAGQHFRIEFVSETWSVVEDNMSILNCGLVNKDRLSPACVNIPVLSHWRVRRGHLEVISRRANPM